MEVNNLSDQPQVLVVDDIPKNLQVIGNILLKQNIKPYFSVSGENALQFLETNKPDLILLDVSMPEMDGFDVCRKIKENPDTAQIPIIFVTAHNQTEEVVKGFELGAVDYVTKPFNPGELISRIGTHIKLSRALQTIKKQNDELIQLNATKNKLFSIIGHDLRGPFNSIFGFSDMLSRTFRDLEAEKTEEYLTIISSQSKNTFYLLENLLQWTRAQTGQLNFSPQKVNLNEVVENTIQLLLYLADAKRIEIISDLPDHCTTFADENMLMAVFRNLISNAIKFTRPEHNIFVSVIVGESEYTISIVDEGIGIKPENIDKIFNTAEHFSTIGTNSEKGSGLGLMLCKEFIEKHGGKIWVKSEVEVGTEFSFTLPIG